MHTAESLKQDLGHLGVDPSGILLVHSSYKAIGETEGRGEAVLDSLIDYMETGLLLLPSHTWESVNSVNTENPVMDVRTTPSCVGILPELFRKRPGVHRSLHPTHSVCGLGRYAVDFLAGDHLADTPCGFRTVYRRIYEQNGQILLIGVDFMSNTFIHGIEEWCGVPGILKEERTPLYVVDHDGNTHSTPMHCHTPSCCSSKAFESEEAMIAAGAVTRGKFGNADCLLCDAGKLSDELERMIKTGKICFPPSPSATARTPCNLS